MAVMQIRKYGDPVLRQKAVPQQTFDGELRQLAEDMIETMQVSEGVGLAANQVGLRNALCIVDMGLIKEGDKPRIFVNPVVLEEQGKTVTMEEGCLSIPGITENVDRRERIRVRYQDLDGTPHEEQVDGMLARVLQHEIDHLNGVFFVDRLNPFLRKMLSKKLRALAEQAQLDRVEAGVAI